MKTFKKVFALLLSLVIVMSLGMTAAAANDGTITVNSARWEQKYNIYRIFDLEGGQKDPDGNFTAFAYTISAKWANFFKTGSQALNYVDITDGYVTWSKSKTAADAAEFAKLAIAYAQTNSIAPDATKTAPAKGSNTGDTTTVTFNKLPYGYYLVESTLGALCSIDTTKPSATINEKNDIPQIVKEVKENPAGSWGSTNDANIGDTVDFRAIITVKAGAENYVVHDKMSSGLLFDSKSVKVTIGGTTDVAAKNYSVVTSTNDGDTFDVEFNDDYIKSLAVGTKIYVNYSALVTKDAIVCGNGNPNTVTLTFGDNNRTVESTTKTYVWEFFVFKYTMNDKEKMPLAGAEFVLCTDSALKNAVKLCALTDNNGIPSYQVCTDDDCKDTHITTITTDSNGKFNINGLDSATYYLKETKAPKGYNLITGAIPVTVSNDAGSVSVNGTVLTNKTVEVENKTGFALPSAGGAGTTVFTAVGSILMIGAAIVFVAKKKISANKS